MFFFSNHSKIHTNFFYFSPFYLHLHEISTFLKHKSSLFHLHSKNHKNSTISFRNISTHMKNIHKIILISSLSLSFVFFIIIFLICICRRKGSTKEEYCDKESNFECVAEEMEIKGDLFKFNGGEDLTCYDILNAPGEVIGKSSYGTLYKANLVKSDSIVLLRFLRPACTGKVQDVMHVAQLLGSVRHPNLVPLCGFYAGPKGEKLLVHPFYKRGNLAQFIKDGNGESPKWRVIYRISTGIASGLDHLHTGLQNSIIHGNLKSKNIHLGKNQHPFVSDFALNLLLNPNAAQEMLEDAAIEGYKAPELTQTKNTSMETDVFNLGRIFLELLNHKKHVFDNPIMGLYHNGILQDQNNNGRNSQDNEEHVLKFFELAIACCSPEPLLRPGIKQICKKLEEIGQ